VEKLDKYTPAQARKLKGLSQAKMARLMGISKNTYINKEKGETKFYIDEACKFSDLVGIPLQNIIFFKNNVP
jgi:DNA-binding XRE family transcriptional regulator